MFQLSPIVIVSALRLIHLSVAQFPPPVTYDTILNSPINPNITISYKTPEPGTCVTAFPNQKQYTGYVHLPPFTLTPYQQNYSINTFFWFVEARTSPETAPLTIWLNGGPGASSMIGLFTENGPCEVVQLQDGSYGTQSRLWGWDRSSNMLFIDQPTQTGFSYDELVNGSVAFPDEQRYVPPRSSPEGFPSYAFLNGTFATADAYSTQNTSIIAASASWHFLQAFLSAFPQYNPGTHPNNSATEATGINLFVESYGGMFGPAFADFYEMQNSRRSTGNLPGNGTLEIKIASLGIVNGLVDELIQAPWWPKFAYDNSYGIQVIDQTTELNALSDFQASGGCRELTNRCRTSTALLDPLGEGDDTSTNRICSTARQKCERILNIALSTRSPYDIRGVRPYSYSDSAFLEYLNTASVQQSIGAKVNFTMAGTPVFRAFNNTGDQARGTQMKSLAGLLSKGIRVAFIYGDADLICNWRGGEEVSLDLARSLPNYSAEFPASGYADIVVNSSYIGGQVRQFGNLSFARIYDAGHTVPSYQPETAFTVFTRVLQGTDIGMGKKVDLSKFRTSGPAESNHRNKVPVQAKHVCWVRDMQSTCTSEDLKLMDLGQGVVINGVWYAQESDYSPFSSSALAGKPGSLPTVPPTPTTASTSTIPLTGVYTASETPRTTSGASSLKPPFRFQRRQTVVEVVTPTTVPVLLRPFASSKPNPDRHRANRFKKALTITAATLGSLLLLSLISSCVLCLALLRPRGRVPRAPLGNPNLGPRRPNMIQRLARRAAPGRGPAVPPQRDGSLEDPLPAPRMPSTTRPRSGTLNTIPERWAVNNPVVPPLATSAVPTATVPLAVPSERAGMAAGRSPAPLAPTPGLSVPRSPTPPLSGLAPAESSRGHLS